MHTITIDFNHSKGTINRNIYGHFTEHIGGVFYDGLWVGPDSKIENYNGFRKKLIDSFKKIAPPVLRWPGGCFAETYDWRDGIGPREKRPARAPWWYYHDKRMESNAVGTHEFMELCRLVGAEPYIAANMTSTSPLHIRNWMEYCNLPADISTLAKERGENGDVEPFNVHYWGIGNENWGGGGQMTPEDTIREFKRYTTVCSSLGMEGIKFIMCGASQHDVAWTRRLMKEWQAQGFHMAPAYGVSIHYYTQISHKDNPHTFDEQQWNHCIFDASYMKHILDDHRGAMDEFDPKRKLKIILDEWGNWHVDGTGPSKGYNLFEQQSNMRDAVVAALTLNIFNNRCDFVDMANVAQLVNNLHSLYLTSGENFVETVNYHVFDMFKGHQEARQLDTIVNSGVMEHPGYEAMESVSASASVKDGVLTLTLANMDMTASRTLTLGALGGSVAGKGELRVLTHEDPHTCNTFEQPDAVVPVCREIDVTDGMELTLPAASVVALTVKLNEVK